MSVTAELRVPSPYCLPDETIAGTAKVGIPPNKFKSMGKVTVYLEGREVVKRHVRADRQIVKVPLVLWDPDVDSTNHNRSMTSGASLDLPFELHGMQPHFPGSTDEHKVGFIRYRVRLEVSFKNGRSLFKDVPLVVLTHPNELAKLATIEDTYKKVDRTVSFLGFKKGLIKASILVNPTESDPIRALVFQAGERIPVEVKITNNSGMALPTKRLELVRVVHVGQTPKSPGKAIRFVLDKRNLEGLEASNSHEIHLLMPAAEMTIKGAHIYIEHHVCLVLATSFGHKFHGLVVPVFAARARAEPQEVEIETPRPHSSGSFKMRPNPRQSTASRIRTSGGDEGSSETSCAICLDRPIDSVFVPCGHRAGCFQCAQKITTCVVCRANATVVRTFDAGAK